MCVFNVPSLCVLPAQINAAIRLVAGRHGVALADCETHTAGLMTDQVFRWGAVLLVVYCFRCMWYCRTVSMRMHVALVDCETHRT